MGKQHSRVSSDGEVAGLYRTFFAGCGANFFSKLGMWSQYQSANSEHKHAHTCFLAIVVSQCLAAITYAVCDGIRGPAASTDKVLLTLQTSTLLEFARQGRLNSMYVNAHWIPRSFCGNPCTANGSYIVGRNSVALVEMGASARDVCASEIGRMTPLWSPHPGIRVPCSVSVSCVRSTLRARVSAEPCPCTGSVSCSCCSYLGWVAFLSLEFRLVSRLASRCVSRCVSRLESRQGTKPFPQPPYQPKGGRKGIILCPGYWFCNLEQTTSIVHFPLAAQPCQHVAVSVSAAGAAAAAAASS
jgi:hypothetical protein